MVAEEWAWVVGDQNVGPTFPAGLKPCSYAPYSVAESSAQPGRATRMSPLRLEMRLRRAQSTPRMRVPVEERVPPVPLTQARRASLT
jgi:hypothetical protein